MTETTTEPTGLNKQDITAALRRFTNSRPGLDFGNYGEVKSYRAECRSVAKDRSDALNLIRAVELSSMPVETLRDAFRAFSGRLSLMPDGRLEYVTGQYYPTEYRKAVAAVCAAAMWAYWRASCMPAPTYKHYGKAGEPMITEARYDGLSAGDFLRRCARRAFQRGIVSRWFN